jgi:CheY-like chemotaxis protein
VKADPGQIEQVLLNLVVNARDAMPQGGELTIETDNVELGEDYATAHAGVRPGWYVMLAVTDTGVGMTKDVRQHVFEPFFTTKGLGKGTGLGLSVVHGIVMQSSGMIEVYSEEWLGTSFNIYLPRVEQSAPAGEPLPTLGPSPHGTETILLVEDEDGVRALTRFILQDRGYTVLEASGGEAALDIATNHRAPIHLLVADVVMPNMDGRALAERALVLHPEMKVLYISGYTDDAVVRHGILHEQVHFLQKPFSPIALAHKVRDVLTRR